MANRAMASGAGDILIVAASAADSLYDIFVALQASALGDTVVAWGDDDLVRKALCGEGQRVEEAVDRLSRVLGDQPGWRMTVIADRNLAMAGLHPALILCAHDVAVGASLRIIRKITRALGIPERVNPRSDQDARDYSQNYRCRDTSLGSGRHVDPIIPHSPDDDK